MTEEFIWVDLDTGTMLNGPVVRIPWTDDLNTMTDLEVIERGQEILKRILEGQGPDSQPI